MSADAFLREWIPRIQASPAYREGGMIVVTFDEAEDGPGGDADSSACCDQPQFPNTPNNGGPTPGQGGGRSRRRAALPVRQARLHQPDRLQPLLPAAQRRGHLRPRPPGLRRRAGLKTFGPEVFNAGAPQLKRLAVRPARLLAARAAARKGATISYELSQPARVTFAVDHGLLGRRSRGKCRKPTRRNRRGRPCRRYKRMRGGLAQTGVQGANSLPFRGRLRGKRLKAGHYRLIAAASGYAGTSRRATRYFRVKAAKKKKHAKRRRR